MFKGAFQFGQKPVAQPQYAPQPIAPAPQPIAPTPRYAPAPQPDDPEVAKLKAFS